MVQTRNSVFILVAASFWMVSIFTNCEFPSTKETEDRDKAAKVEENAVFAQQDRMQVQRDSVAGYKIFKEEAEAKILKNSQIIANFKVKIMTGEKAMKVRYQKRLNELENENNALKNKLERYYETGTENWGQFKSAWEKDMGRLVKSLNEMTQNNKQ
ncbi:MAG TPA: hypothetical protein PK228_20350 [Saprospiraceae bacterium]|nr:hypothetical protein [Saprospiraceae bacterium]